MKYFVSLVIFFFIFIIFPGETLAATVSYTITPWIAPYPAPSVGATFYTKDLTVTYQSGKIILSGNSDGTGNTFADDAVEITVTKPDGSTGTFDHSYQSTCSRLDSMPPQDITNLFGTGENKVHVRLYDMCGGSVAADAMYLVNINAPNQANEPFLDLPWDYKSTGKSFEQMALNPNSWFDHHYPLQNIPCCEKNVLLYTGLSEPVFYHSHSGYDYGLIHGVRLGTSVLAAASGWATFTPESKSGGGGNVIKIDHGNGYQTWYEHLQLDGLIVNTEGQRVYVEKGQQIGKTGFTGNAFPKDEHGAHIHFSVFRDINNNGTFSDDYPYGLVDPLGWEGDYKDPWTEYGSGDKHGAESFNLFLARAKPKVQAIPKTGGELVVENKVKVSVPQDALPLDFTIKFKDGPFESQGSLLESIVPSFFLNAANSIGDTITQFFKPITITYDYAQADLLNINEDTLKLYYFNEQTQTWEALPSTVDKTTKTIKAETTHFSHFAIMGEIKDRIAPITQIAVHGDKGQENWYKSSVTIELSGQDNDGGVGLEYTLYQVDGQDWKEYSAPIVIEGEGEHSISYLSVDKAENQEEIKTEKFYIDRTPPEAIIQYDTQKQDLIISGTDISGGPTVNQTSTGRTTDDITMTDKAGNIMLLQDTDREHGSNAVFSIANLSYNGISTIPDTNKLSIRYQLDKNNAVKTLEQKFEMRGVVKILLSYDPQANKTTITTNGQKFTVDGMKILQIYTEKGTLNYRY